MGKTQLVPCIVKTDGIAEEDSLEYRATAFHELCIFVWSMHAVGLLASTPPVGSGAGSKSAGVAVEREGAGGGL